VAGNMAKFGQYPELREFLVGTTVRVLVGASPVDWVRGIGFLPADNPRADDPEHWHGHNLLGFALMDTRSIQSLARGADGEHTADPNRVELR
jgi:ribA/ribD-fused uncharacterized protein